MMIVRAAFAVVLAVNLLAVPLAAEAQQQAGKGYRVGVLWLNSLQADSHLLEAFRQGLREFVGVEERSIVVEFRSAEGNPSKLPGLVAELVRLKVDIIVADVTPAIRSAMRGTSTVPIVMAIAADPVGSGLVSSLARPGGNVTGLSLMLPEISAKRLQLLKEVLPKISRVAVLWHPDIPWHTPMLKAIDSALPPLGLQALPIPVRSPDEFEGAFSTMTKGHVGALFVGDNPVYLIHRDRLLALAAKHRLPTLFGHREFVPAGGLMSYGPSLADLFRRAAGYVDKIRKGAKPADLPVDQADKFELVINLRTAKTLGLTIPPSVLGRADEVIR
ncbi:MAG TPA: ABC transporter substrate-binding protein [Pseudomonadales bacterium]|nr:ABC transporter substrate-binding protein [Pseudomonadales bacterium]